MMQLTMLWLLLGTGEVPSCASTGLPPHSWITVKRCIAVKGHAPPPICSGQTIWCLLHVSRLHKVVRQCMLCMLQRLRTTLSTCATWPRQAPKAVPHQNVLPWLCKVSLDVCAKLTSSWGCLVRTTAAVVACMMIVISVQSVQSVQQPPRVL